MVHTPKTLTSYLISFLISTLALTSGSLCAQENVPEIKKEGELPSAPPQSDAKDDAYQTCMENFDINTLNLKDPQIIPLLPLLVDYYQCNAVAKDNVGICNQLYWADRIAACTQAFEEYHASYGILLTTKEPKHPKFISSCARSLGWTQEQCVTFGKALLDGNVTWCDGIPNPKSRSECKAMMSGDASSCGGQKDCLMKTNYVKAVKTGGPELCKKLKYTHLTSMCDYSARRSVDEKICEKNNKFKQFQKKVCETKTSVKESTK